MSSIEHDVVTIPKGWRRLPLMAGAKEHVYNSPSGFVREPTYGNPRYSIAYGWWWRWDADLPVKPIVRKQADE